MGPTINFRPGWPRDLADGHTRGKVFGTEDAGASWQEHRLPSGVEDVYAVAYR